jgi:hypothetical protein
LNAPERQPLAVETSHGATDFERLLDQSYSPRAMLEGNSMDKMMRMAEQMAVSKLSVPDHLRGNVGDCLAIVTQAMLWNMNPFAVAQKTHLVSGKLGYEAQLVNAVLQNSGAVSGLPQYEYKGDGNNLECRVGFVPRGGSVVVWGEFLKISDVTTKNSPLWKTNPKQQLGYLQIKNWARAYVPGAILGVYTEDEFVEQQGAGFTEVDNITQPASGPRRKSETAASQADPATGETTPPPAAEAAASAPAPAASNAPAKAGGITGGQVAYLRNKIKAAGLDEATFCDRFQVTGIELLSAEQFDTIKAELLAAG